MYSIYRLLLICYYSSKNEKNKIIHKNRNNIFRSYNQVDINKHYKYNINEIFYLIGLEYIKYIRV